MTNNDKFKGAGDDRREPSPFFKGVRMALVIVAVAVVCLSAAFFLEDPVKWQDVVAIGMAVAATAVAGRALWRMLNGKASGRTR